jgi:hypothetical protein
MTACGPSRIEGTHGMRLGLRILLGLVTGFLLFYPGVAFLTGVTWGLSGDLGRMTLEEALLAVVLILLVVHIVRQSESARSPAVKTVYGVLIGIALFYPGTLAVRWAAVDALGLVDRMSTSEALLVIIVTALSVLIWQTPARVGRRLREVRGDRD